MSRARLFLGVAFLIGIPAVLIWTRAWTDLAIAGGIIAALLALVLLRKRANPNLDQEYRSKAQAVVGDATPVIAASLMAPEDKSGKLIWSMFKGSLAGEIVGGLTGATVDQISVGADIGGTIGMLRGMHAARRENAEEQGLVPVVLVAITETTIEILDWPRPDQTAYVAISETSIEPTRVLKTLDRATTLAKRTSQGYRASLYLANTVTGESIALQAGTNPATADAKPTKALLAVLGV